MKCPHCHGDVLKDCDENSCILCARYFDDDGRELVPVMATEKPKREPVGNHRQVKHRSKVIYRNNW